MAKASPLASVAATREVLERHGAWTKHGLGQNFLVNDDVVRRILELSAVGPDDVVLEVGPGIGTLTFALLAHARHVVAVEKDPALPPILADTLAGVTAPSVYLAGNSSMLSTAGNAMYQSDMIRLAGGVNVAAEIEDSYWVEISYEQLLTWNPEYIILASDAAYTVEDVLADPNLADCAAVVSGHVYQLPSKAEAWDSPVPSGILGALWLANVLHADLLTDDDYAAKVDEYYETFYGFTYSAN